MTRILVVNAGSSTLKLRVIGPTDDVEGEIDLDHWEQDEGTDAVAHLLADAGDVDAVGHRVVHGGRDLVEPTVVTADVEARIEALAPLAPLHQPRAIAGVRAARRAAPGVPHVACFDTAFHATLPPAARTYALPPAWRDRWGLDRFGFHGLSHAWAARRGPAVAGLAGAAARRIVTCHLGAGASLCAVLDGASVDTTMGFTPLEGLVMATRSGSVDPGLVLWLLTGAGLDAAEVADGLERRSGLAGLSATNGDMREVLAARAAGVAGASLAFDVFAHRLRREIAAMAASLGGVDQLVFTGGIGEHAPAVRAAAADGLAFLGIGVDADANEAVTGDGDISAPGAPVSTVVVTSREDLAIAGEVRRNLVQVRRGRTDRRPL